jgi:molecular chaperone DnaK
MFSTAEDNQSSVDIYVFQGERPMARDNKTLANFRLDGISAAVRGTSRIEVSFDIDANGILNVAAKDETTGKEQKITISASTNLSKEDIQRLLQEATENAAVDRSMKEEADARNEADQACYLVEHELKEGAGKVRATNRSRAELLVGDLRQKLERRESMQEIKTMTADLKGLLAMIREDINTPSDSNNNAAQSQSGSNNSNRNSKGADDDIVDAEYSAA